MGKIKEDLKIMMKYYDWKQFIVGIIAAVAVAATLSGIVLPLLTGNVWYLLLGIVTILCTGFIAGVNG